MFASIQFHNRTFQVDLNHPIDISIPLRQGNENANAWYVDPVAMEPVRTNQFTGSVAEGGVVNFRNILFNPHGNGTHTECVGHISRDVHSVNRSLTNYFFMASLVTVEPEVLTEDRGTCKAGDAVITLEQLKLVIDRDAPEALIIRTLPNESTKLTRQYSNSNPPYLEEAAATYIRQAEIKHLLIDLPSVDREFDDGRLLAHRAFWNYPDAPRMDCTITELIFVPTEVSDGEYLLNLQIASFENDATPSKPILFAFK